MAVLGKITNARSHQFHEALIGGAAIDASGNPLPDESLQACKQADAILLGAVGGPNGAIRTRRCGPSRACSSCARNSACTQSASGDGHCGLGGLVAGEIRSPRGVDMLVVPNSPAASISGEKRRDGDTAFDGCSYKVFEVERVVRLAARLAGKRKKRLTQVDKANVLETSASVAPGRPRG